MKGVRVNIFWWNFRPVLDKFVSSTFGKKEWPLIYYHSVFLTGAKVQYFSYWWKLSSAIIFNNLWALTGTIDAAAWLMITMAHINRIALLIITWLKWFKLVKIKDKMKFTS